MNRISRTLLGVGIGLMACSSAVWAGTAPGAGTIVYSPDAQHAVPTLSGWTLIVLALLFGVIAYRVIREKHGRTLASLTATGIIAAGASSGVTLIEESHAAAKAILLQVSTGSSVSIEEGQQLYQNDTSVPQRIRSITYNRNCGPGSAAPLFSPACSVNLLLQPTESCGLNTDCDTDT